VLDVEIRNFQSIEKASFQIDGFTVVVGRSNIGKSALVRAIKAALTGASVSSFVRHGAGCLRRTKQAKTCKCFASVHLKTEGFDLLWEKGDSLNRYTFNGVIYDKAERGTPDFLQPVFAPVKVGDKQELLQVSDQFSPIFLLDQTGGAVADTLSDVARLDRINWAMRLAEKDRKEAVSTRKVREKDVVALRSKLTAYDGLDDVLGAVQRTTESQDAILRQERVLAQVDTFLQSATALAGTLRDLAKGASVVVPDPKSIKDMARVLESINAYMTQLEDRRQGVTHLASVEQVEIPSATSLTTGLSSLQQLNRWVQQLAEIKGWLTSGKSLDGFSVPSPEGLHAGWSNLRNLDVFTQKYEALTQTCSDLERDLEETVKEEQALNEERDALGVCPTCIRPLGECQDA
jgi:hypothetical protein